MLTSTAVPALSSLLALLAGSIHLARVLIPMGSRPSGTGGPPPGPPPGGAGAPSALMGLVMPHLNQLFVLNFVAFVGLAVVLFVVARGRPLLRTAIDVVLGVLSGITLYAWNEMGRINPGGTGTMAMIVELALIVLVVADSVFMLVRARMRGADVGAAACTPPGGMSMVVRDFREVEHG